MKEIVVIPKEHIEYEQISGAGFDTIRFHLGTDKRLSMPTMFEEVKALFLNKLAELNVMWFGDRFVENKSEEFWVKGILFKADKTLSIRDDNDNIRVIMTNIDYPLMWALIQTTLNIKSNHL